MAAAGITLGLALGYRAYESFTSAGLGREGLLMTFLALVCVYGAGISKKLYLSEAGVIREMHSWGRVLRRVLPWGDVRRVSLAYRGAHVMAFFDAGATGWKVLFSEDQEGTLLDILDEYIPDVEIEVIEKKR
jgi:hypothetical protein